MAVNRLWFPNAPSGDVDAAQRAQIGIGYSGIALSADTLAGREPYTITDQSVPYRIVEVDL